eukprot:s2278_g9.t1
MKKCTVLWREAHFEDARVDSNAVARKKLLELLEHNPQAAQTDKDAEKKVRKLLQDAPEAAKRIVVIGRTGAGKSTFCGFLDGSLRKDPNMKGKHAWQSPDFKMGHHMKSETNEPKLKFCHWRGVDATLPIIIMDTPGTQDSRGDGTNEKHLRTIAGWVNGLSHIHLVILLVNPDSRMSCSDRQTLLEFQKRFGRKLWAHTMVAVNKWTFSQNNLPEEYEEDFRAELQEPIQSGLPGETGDAHLGLGLSEEECKKIPFAFLNVQYHHDDKDFLEVADAMKIELDKMKAKLKELLPWHVRVKGQSEPLNALIEEVRKSDKSEKLKKVFDQVNSMVDKPADLTEQKLRAVDQEIVRRGELEAAEKNLTEAVEAFDKFKEVGARRHADTFVQKFDTALKNLPDALLNPRISRLKPSWNLLKAALEGEKQLCNDLPTDLQKKVDTLIADAKRTKIIESVLSAWNISLINDQSNQVCEWGVGSEAELAQHILTSLTVLNNFRPADRRRAAIFAKWHGLKYSSTKEWVDASVAIKELEELLRDSKATEVPLKHVQEMKEKLEKTKGKDGKGKGKDGNGWAEEIRDGLSERGCADVCGRRGREGQDGTGGENGRPSMHDMSELGCVDICGQRKAQGNVWTWERRRAWWGGKKGSLGMSERGCAGV